MEPALRPVLVPKSGGDEFDRLKTLLFRPEAKRLEEIETAVLGLDARVGTPDRLEAATTQVLVKALKRAEVAQHRELSQAIAPVVVAAIRSEIKNSRDMMVEALYPITGRLVSAGIAVALAELAASVNARMDSLLSARSIGLRIRAWRSGRPFAELALAQPLPGRLVRLLQLERGSGVLLGQWQADQGADERADLIGGMIAALTDFARNALGPSGGELRTLDLGGRLIYLRSSARMIVAADYAGPLLPAQQSALDSGFFDLLEAHERDGDAPAAALEHLAAALSAAPVAGAKPRWRPSPLLVVGLLLLAGLAWWGFFAQRRWRLEARVAQAVHRVVSSRPELAAYPVFADAQHGAATIALRGLVPDAADRATLEAAVALAGAPYALASTIAVVGTAREAADLRAQLEGLAKLLAAQAGELEAARARLAGETQAEASALRGQIADAQAKLGVQIEAQRAALGLELQAAKDGQQEQAVAAEARLAGQQGELSAQAEAKRVGLALELKEAKDAQARQLAESLERMAAMQTQTRAGLAALSGSLAAASGSLEARIEAENGALRGQIADARAQLGAQMEAQRAALALELKAAKDGQQEQAVAAEARLAGLQGELSAQSAQQAGMKAAMDSGQRQAAGLEARIAAMQGDLSAKAGARIGELRAQSEASQAALALELKAAKDGQARQGAEIGERMAAMQTQTRESFAALSGSLAAASGALEARIATSDAAMRDQAAAADARARAETAALQAGLARTGEALAGAQARLDAPVARLAEALRGFAVFFEDNDAIIDEASVRAKLAEIARLAGPAGGIRIHGHSDAKGSPARNQAVSRQRAEAVARLLADLGVDRARMVVVSHGSSQPLADAADGNGRRNRRVTLEPLLAGELPP